MKKLLVLFISFMPMLASADYLDIEIKELISKKQDLIAQLEECEESVGGLKIAGLVTLGVSTIGVATNIGEAVALKGLQSDVEAAKATKAGLDAKISEIKIEIAANNTCGGDNCVGDGVSVADGLNGTGPVCINDIWAVKLCKVGFNGVGPKTCKRNGVAVTYYDACTKDVLFDTCGAENCDSTKKETAIAGLNGTGALCVNNTWTVQTCNQGYIGEKKTCNRNGISYDYYFSCFKDSGFDSCGTENCNDGSKAEAEARLHGAPAVCINNNWAVRSCNVNYIGKEEQCNRNGELMTYYHQCVEQDGRNTCGGDNCVGSVDPALNGSVPICVGDRWRVTVCNEGYSGKTSTCTRNGVTETYYGNGCSKVVVPDGVTVRDLGNGQYFITVDKGGKTTNEGDKSIIGDSNSYTYYVTSDGGIAKVDGQPGNYTYTTHNGDVYNIENLRIDGGSGKGSLIGGSVPMPASNRATLSLVAGTSTTIDFSKYFNCDDLTISATSSNPSVVDAQVNGTILKITGTQKTTSAETVDVTVNCGGTESKYIYGVTVNETGADITIKTASVGIDFGSQTINLGSYECASGIVVDATSSNESVVTVIKNGNNISLEYKNPGTAELTVQIKCGKDVLDTHTYKITVPNEGEEVEVKITSGKQKGTKFTSTKTSPQDEDVLKISIEGKTEEGDVNEEVFTVIEASEAKVGPCKSITQSFNDAVLFYYANAKPIIGLYTSGSVNNNLVDLDTNYYKISYASGGGSTSIRQMIYSCPRTSSLHFFPVSEIKKDGDSNFITLEARHFTRGFCMSSCPGDQGAQFEYEAVYVAGKGKLPMYSTMACYLNKEHALDICQRYCESRGEPDSERFSASSCTTNLVAIKDSKCMCNQDVSGVWTYKTFQTSN